MSTALPYEFRSTPGIALYAEPYVASAVATHFSVEDPNLRHVPSTTLSVYESDENRVEIGPAFSMDTPGSFTPQRFMAGEALSHCIGRYFYLKDIVVPQPYQVTHDERFRSGAPYDSRVYVVENGRQAHAAVVMNKAPGETLTGYNPATGRTDLTDGMLEQIATAQAAIHTFSGPDKSNGDLRNHQRVSDTDLWRRYGQAISGIMARRPPIGEHDKDNFIDRNLRPTPYEDVDIYQLPAVDFAIGYTDDMWHKGKLPQSLVPTNMTLDSIRVMGQDITGITDLTHGAQIAPRIVDAAGMAWSIFERSGPTLTDRIQSVETYMDAYFSKLTNPAPKIVERRAWRDFVVIQGALAWHKARLQSAEAAHPKAQLVLDYLDQPHFTEDTVRNQYMAAVDDIKLQRLLGN